MGMMKEAIKRGDQRSLFDPATLKSSSANLVEFERVSFAPLSFSLNSCPVKVSEKRSQKKSLITIPIEASSS